MCNSLCLDLVTNSSESPVVLLNLPMLLYPTVLGGVPKVKSSGLHPYTFRSYT